MKKITKAMLFAGAVAAVAGAFTGCVNDVEAEKTYVEIKAPNVKNLKAQSIESGRALLVTWTPTNTGFSGAIVSPLGYTNTFDVDADGAKKGYAVVKVDDNFSLKQDEVYTIVISKAGTGLGAATANGNVNQSGNTLVNELESVVTYTYKSDVTSPEAASKLDPYTADDVKVYLKEDNSKYAMVFNGSNTHQLYGQTYEIFIAGTDYRVAIGAPSQFTTTEFPYIGSSVDVKIKKTWTGNIGASAVKYYQDSDEYVVTLTRAEDPAGEVATVSGFTATASTDKKNVEIGWSTTSDVNKVSFKIYKAEADVEGKLVGAVTEVASVGAECLVRTDVGNIYAYKDTLGSGKKYQYYIVAYNSKGNAKGWATAAEVDGNYQAGEAATNFAMKADAAVNEGKFAFTWNGDKNTDYTLYYTTVDYRGVESERKPLEASSTYDLAKNEYAFNSKLAYNPSSAVETQKYNFYLVSSKDDKLLGTDVRDYTLPNAKVAYATVDTDLEVSANKVTIKGTKLNYATKPTVISIKKDGENKWTEKKVTFNLNTANTELSANVEIAAGTEVRVMLDKTKIMGLGDYTDAEEELWGRY